MSSLLPRQPAPPLDLPLAGGGGRWSLADQAPEAFTLLVFYRGLHCPQCQKQLTELDGKLEMLAEVGISSVVAISGDTPERAAKAVKEWKLGHVPVAHDLTEEQMRAWGLFVSKGVKDPEPDLFSEPAMFLVDPTGTVYSAHVQSTPFARPHLDNLIAAVRYINDNDYPARGEA